MGKIALEAHPPKKKKEGEEEKEGKTAWCAGFSSSCTRGCKGGRGSVLRKGGEKKKKKRKSPCVDPSARRCPPLSASSTERDSLQLNEGGKKKKGGEGKGVIGTVILPS